MNTAIVENAKVMAKGQITLPKDIRAALGLVAGDRVTLIKQDNQVIMMNSTVYAMKIFQQAMEGEAEKEDAFGESSMRYLSSKIKKMLQPLKSD